MSKSSSSHSTRHDTESPLAIATRPNDKWNEYWGQNQNCALGHSHYTCIPQGYTNSCSHFMNLDKRSTHLTLSRDYIIITTHVDINTHAEQSQLWLNIVSLVNPLHRSWLCVMYLIYYYYYKCHNQPKLVVWMAAADLNSKLAMSTALFNRNSIESNRSSALLF